MAAIRKLRRGVDAAIEDLQEQIDNLRADVAVLLQERQAATAPPAAPKPTPAKVAAAAAAVKKST